MKSENIVINTNLVKFNQTSKWAEYIHGCLSLGIQDFSVTWLI